MSTTERLDSFAASVPRCCLWCAYGFPIVFGMDDFFNEFACGMSAARGVRSKKVEARIAYSDAVNPEPPKVLIAVTAPSDSCDRFVPLTPFGSGWRNMRKLRLMELFGYLEGFSSAAKIASKGKQSPAGGALDADAHNSPYNG